MSAAEQRWAIVTAGAQGLGEAISAHLLRSGYDVFVHCFRSIERGEALVRSAHALGRSAHVLQGDLSTSLGRRMMMDQVASLLPEGAVHLLVNNLGVYPVEHLLETTIEQWERTFALTCTSVFHMTQLALPWLRRASPPARVINVGDAGCDRIEAHVDATAYHIAKLGVHVLTRTYAKELMQAGITVNMISPGFMTNSVGEPDVPIPAGRRGTFEDILGAIDYLLSGSAAYTSGANIVVSGAWNLG